MHSLTTVGLVWSMLSFIVAIVCSTGFYLPYWLQGQIMNVTVHLGVFRRCNYFAKNKNAVNSFYLHEGCGRYKSFDDIPSTAWQGSTILLGMACGILVLISLISLLAICFKDIITKQTARVCGFFQALAAFFLIIACVIFPFGWDNIEVRQACGDVADKYRFGDCKFGWAAFLVATGAVGTLLCSFLSIKSGKSDRMKALSYEARYDTIQLRDNQF